MNLIGLAGAFHAGKDTVADLIIDRVPHFHRASFAGALRSYAATLFDLTSAQLTIDKDVVGKNGLTGREILQHLGTACRDIDPYVWVRQLDNSIVSLSIDTLVIVTDVRYPNEAQWIRDHGGRLWFVDRLDAATDKNPSRSHVSESHYEFLRDHADHVIVNDGSLDQLGIQVADLCTTEHVGGLRPARYNGGVRCDMDRGPCACGAWH